jgi:hypothetical protein
MAENGLYEILNTAFSNHITIIFIVAPCIKVHGATIKIINAQQARIYNINKNTKLKLLKTNI